MNKSLIQIININGLKSRKMDVNLYLCIPKKNKNRICSNFLQTDVQYVNTLIK